MSDLPASDVSDDELRGLILGIISKESDVGHPVIVLRVAPIAVERLAHWLNQTQWEVQADGAGTATSTHSQDTALQEQPGCVDEDKGRNDVVEAPSGKNARDTVSSLGGSTPPVRLYYSQRIAAHQHIARCFLAYVREQAIGVPDFPLLDAVAQLTEHVAGWREGTLLSPPKAQYDASEQLGLEP